DPLFSKQRFSRNLQASSPRFNKRRSDSAGGRGCVICSPVIGRRLSASRKETLGCGSCLVSLQSGWFCTCLAISERYRSVYSEAKEMVLHLSPNGLCQGPQPVARRLFLVVFVCGFSLLSLRVQTQRYLLSRFR